jgi:hypothetical protein
MRPEWLLDMTYPSKLGMQLDALEIVDILSVEKHVPDRRRLLVYLERMAGEDDTLGDDPRRVGREKRPHSNELGR